ncbi:MAG: hypothetical protein BMS9Abin05_1222 [Rhodothermia bacterium]|nr:MAG: hypothetical protein BMS9Abin05_1222 [Rhodothermia bacterium]
MAICAKDTLGIVRPAVAIALLWANFAWAQSAQQPVDSIRLDVTEQYGSNPNAVDTLQSTESVQLTKTRDKPGTVRGITLRLSTGVGYDGNVFRTERNTSSDLFWSLRPAAYLNGVFGKNSYRFGYEGDYAKYSDFSTEDFVDHRVFADTRLDLTRKLDFNLGAQYRLGHDPRGSLGNRLFVPGELDRWEEYRVKAEFVVGREITRAQVIPWVEVSGMRYTNNGQSVRDFDRQDFRLRGRWRFTSRLYGLAEGGYANITHLDSRNTLDRTETDFLLGIGWQATAKTSGEAMFGILNRSFKNAGRANSNAPTWDVRIHWVPKPYSKVTAYTRRSSEENAGGVGNYLSDSYGALWRHAFTERLDLNTSIDYTVADFDSVREDKYVSFDFGLTYEVTRWLDVGATYRYLNRRSNIPGINFDDHMFLLELRVGAARSLGP